MTNVTILCGFNDTRKSLHFYNITKIPTFLKQIAFKDNLYISFIVYKLQYCMLIKLNETVI